MIMADDINNTEYIKNNAAAFFIISFFIVRLNKEVTSLSINVENADATILLISSLSAVNSRMISKVMILEI